MASKKLHATTANQIGFVFHQTSTLASRGAVHQSVLTLAILATILPTTPDSPLAAEYVFAQVKQPSKEDPLVLVTRTHLVTLPRGLVGQVASLVLQDNEQLVLVVGTKATATVSLNTRQVVSINVYQPMPTPNSPQWKYASARDTSLVYQAGADSNVTDLVAYDVKGFQQWKCKVPFDLAGFGGINWVEYLKAKDPTKSRFVCGSTSSKDVYFVSWDGHLAGRETWAKELTGRTCITDTNKDEQDELWYIAGNLLVCRDVEGNKLSEQALCAKEFALHTIRAAPGIDNDSHIGLYVGYRDSDDVDHYKVLTISRNTRLIADSKDYTPINEYASCNCRLRIPGIDGYVLASLAYGENPSIKQKDLGSLFVRVYNAGGLPIDGGARGPTQPEARTWFFSRAPSVVIPDDKGDKILATHSDVELWLYDFRKAVGEK